MKFKNVHSCVFNATVHFTGWLVGAKVTLWSVRLPQQCCWQFGCFGMWCCVTALVFSNMLKKCSTSFFEGSTSNLSGTTHPVTQHLIPEDLNPQQQCCENLKNYGLWLILWHAQILLAEERFSVAGFWNVLMNVMTHKKWGNLLTSFQRTLLHELYNLSC
jgi:hypothetical protein